VRKKLFIQIILICTFFVCQTLIVESCAESKSMRQIEHRSKRNNGLLNNSKSRKVIKAERKAERTKREQEKNYQKAKKKDLKQRYDMQSERTKEMMKETNKKSDKLNKQKRPSFFKRLFQRKPK
jgi:ABC-type bacteriocin/lantibiotic exporter with double-glycine peptidase domain